jgi:integrase
MGFVDKTTAGRFKAYWRDPDGKQRSKTFVLKKDATAFLTEMESTKSRGSYVSPHSGRILFADHAEQWMASWNTAITTAARDRSMMRNHVLPRWGGVQLGKVDHLALQTWVSELGQRRSTATVTRCYLLASAVLRSAVRNRLIPFNPAEEVRIPRIRQHDGTLDRIISRSDLRSRLLPAVPERHRAIVATAAGAGLRWGEAAGLRLDAVDLGQGVIEVVRTVVEVSGHTSFKPFPKSAAGRREVPLPAWLVAIIREHLERWPTEENAPIFANEVGAPLRRTLFRSRIWRPSLVRAGLLGQIRGEGPYLGRWTDVAGERHEEEFRTRAKAVGEVARRQAGGMRFHDLRHSYATWLVDDGVPVNMVQRVLGHEKSSTTLDLYTRRTDNRSRILDALTDKDDDEGGAADALARA